MLLTSPGVAEDRLTGANDRTNAGLASYAAALTDRFTAAGAVVVDGATLLAPLGSDAFADDGLHLTGAAYDLLLPALADAVLVAPSGGELAPIRRRTVSGPPPPRRQPLRWLICSVAAGSTVCRSPTTPKSTSSKIGASSSLLTATIVLEVCMPARCWMAPEMPSAT